MALYRVWGDRVTECFWLVASSEADAIRSVKLAFHRDRAALKAEPSTDNHFVPDGVILMGIGQTFPTPKVDE